MAGTAAGMNLGSDPLLSTTMHTTRQKGLRDYAEYLGVDPDLHPELLGCKVCSCLDPHPQKAFTCAYLPRKYLHAKI